MNTDQFIDKVKNDYNTIASHFSQTRSENKAVLKFIWLNDYLKTIRNPKIIDLGCGNARMVDFFKKNRLRIKSYTGIDQSLSLLKIAKKKYPQADFKLANIAVRLPSNIAKDYDLCLCLAVLHHLPDKKTQLQALKNCYQLLNKNGLLIISVWNLWQLNFLKIQLRQLRLKLKFWNYHYSFVSYKDRITGKKINRFIYGFTKVELISLVKKAGFNIIACFYSQYGKKTNIFNGHDLCLVAKKC